MNTTFCWIIFMIWAFVSGGLVSFIKRPVLRMVMLVAVLIFNWQLTRLLP